MKITRITIETETLTIVRRAKLAPSWCPECRAGVETIILERDGFADPVPTEHLQEWLDSGKLHYWQAADGAARICVTSLLQCLELEAAQRFVLSTKIPSIHNGGNKDETP